MAKSVSPSKGRSGRAKTKSDSKEAKPRSKSRGRPRKDTRGRSPTPKGAKARTPSKKRSPSKSRSRVRSQTRKSEPKPRARSSSRKPSVRKSVPTEAIDEPTTKVTRRSASNREPAKSAEKTLAAEKSFVFGRDSLKTLVSHIRNFGYRRTLSSVWWLLALPAFVMAVHLLCTKDKCYVRIDPTIPKTLKVYLDPLVISYGIGILILQCLLSALPIGQVVTGFGYRRANYQYRSNSLMCLLVSVGLYLFGALYLRLPNFLILQQHRFKCVCGATVIALIYSGILYFKSFKSSPYHVNHGSLCSPGVTKNLVHDFVFGREISPKIRKTFDFGFVSIRFANCLWVLIILATCISARSDGLILGLQPNVALVASFQLIYVFFGSLNEVYLLKSAYIQQGVGFLIVFTTQVLAPFVGTLPLRYLVDSKRPLSCVWCYPLYSFIFVTGLILIHYSNSLKYNNAKSGGKILRSGPWKFVRHPNYLGELLCVLSWTLPCGQAALPYAHLLFVASVVLCRSRQIEKNTNADYRAYQNQVKSRVVPFIY